jgi:probable F420-dependent oxidoreductase
LRRMSNEQRPFRFGVQVDAIGTRDEWTDLARRVESHGYSTLTMPDHFGGQLAPVPALQCAADATSTLRLGALVYDNDFKHPVVLAKELATMDVLSDGRVEIGLGAGWMVTDYEQSGIPYDPPGVRVSRLIEGLAVIKGALGPEAFSFDGDHYTVTDYNGLPKPVQSLPPVLIGGGGPRVLGFAARNADIVGVNSTMTSGAVDASTFETMTADAVDEKVRIVRDAAEAAGRLADIEMNIRAFIVSVTDDVDGALGMLAEFTGAPADVIAESPFALVGPTSKIIDELQERRERWGFSYVIVGKNDTDRYVSPGSRSCRRLAAQATPCTEMIGSPRLSAGLPGTNRTSLGEGAALLDHDDAVRADRETLGVLVRVEPDPRPVRNRDVLVDDATLQARTGADPDPLHQDRVGHVGVVIDEHARADDRPLDV